MIAVADTTPINYLVLIDRAYLLRRLFERVLIPLSVWDELREPETPEAVRAWIADKPRWLEVQSLRLRPDPALEHLDSGEREAIALAEELKADQLLLDEVDARREAARRKLAFIGTLGILRRAAGLDLIDLASDLARLQQTTFYVDRALVQSLLDEEANRRKAGGAPR